jgi:hypothetical protein
LQLLLNLIGTQMKDVAGKQEKSECTATIGFMTHAAAFHPLRNVGRGVTA